MRSNECLGRGSMVYFLRPESTSYSCFPILHLVTRDHFILTLQSVLLGTAVKRWALCCLPMARQVSLFSSPKILLGCPLPTRGCCNAVSATLHPTPPRLATPMLVGFVTHCRPNSTRRHLHYPWVSLLLSSQLSEPSPLNSLLLVPRGQRRAQLCCLPWARIASTHPCWIWNDATQY